MGRQERAEYSGLGPKERIMFALQKISKQKKDDAPFIKSRIMSHDLAHAENSSMPADFMQRSLGNNYIQSLGTDGPSTIQRKCACGGVCTSCQSKGKRIQPKLTVGPANDVYEREADQVADQIMRIPSDSRQHHQTRSSINLHTLRRVPPSDSCRHLQDLPAEVSLPYSGSRPLSDTTRQYMEPRFKTDFSHVRVHTGQAAQDTASKIQAKAFTLGQDIWLGKGAHEGDKRLMAHELTHVVQQQKPDNGLPPSARNLQFADAISHTRSATTSARTIQRLPFGITLPTGLRFLDSTEQTMATGVYGKSLNFSKVLLSNAVGGGGRPFTTYVPSPIPGIDGGTVINIGPSAYNTPGSDRNLLIHELAHSWQSQHHPNPAQFMVNSIASQAAAEVAGASAYCYVPGKAFGLYGAEQIAQQVERGESAIVSEVASVSPGMPHAGNLISLAVPRWETRGDPGVKC